MLEISQYGSAKTTETKTVSLAANNWQEITPSNSMIITGVFCYDSNNQQIELGVKLSIDFKKVYLFSNVAQTITLKITGV